jgi:hypothetical protein
MLQHTIEVQNPNIPGTLSIRATFWACFYPIFSVTSTLLIKRKGFRALTSGYLEEMSGQLKMSEDAKTRYRSAKSATTYKAPTLGLGHIIFKYGERMKPGSFKTMVESIAEHMAATLNYGGPEASKAIKRAEAPPMRNSRNQLETQLPEGGYCGLIRNGTSGRRKSRPGKRILERFLRNCHPTVLLT